MVLRAVPEESRYFLLTVLQLNQLLFTLIFVAGTQVEGAKDSEYCKIK